MKDTLTLGIAGLGTIGGGLLRLLDEHGDRLAGMLGRRIEVVGVSARSRDKARSFGIGHFRWFDDAVKLATDPSIAVFVELIGGDTLRWDSEAGAADAGDVRPREFDPGNARILQRTR